MGNKRNKNKRIPSSASKDVRQAKHPTHIEDPDSFYNYFPSWRFMRCDCDHERWRVASDVITDELLNHLSSYESRKWSEILQDASGRRRNTRNHLVYFEDMVREARQRAVQLKLDSEDGLYSLALSGKKRLWGVMQSEGVFCIVWYDPGHEICPSRKRYT